MKIGEKMATQQDENRKKMDHKKRFFSKRAQDFELLKQVPKNSHETGLFGRNQYIGILILS